LTVPYNPQQNGVAERKNMAIVGATRSMLHDQALPFYLWVEACSTAVYLQNRSQRAERFGSHLAMVMSRSETDATFDE
jgi:hypothetical protein